jgi:hypothetical protein
MTGARQCDNRGIGQLPTTKPAANGTNTSRTGRHQFIAGSDTPNPRSPMSAGHRS